MGWVERIEEDVEERYRRLNVTRGRHGAAEGGGSSSMER